MTKAEEDGAVPEDGAVQEDDVVAEPASASIDPARRRRSRLLMALALVLLVVGAAGIAASSTLPAAEARVLGGNRPVNEGATDALDVRALNSPTVVANPRDPANLVVTSRVDSSGFGCAMHLSLDAGAHWTEVAMPAIPDTLVSCFAPDAAFGPDGVLYASFSTFDTVEQQGIVPDAVWVVRSTDGGRTLSAPVKAHGPLAFHVRMATDPRRAGRIYLIWLQASETTASGLPNTGNPISVARSDDGGATWEAPVTVSAPTRLRPAAPTMAVDSAGAVHVAYLDVGDDALDYSGAHQGQGGEPYAETWSVVVARSSDGGDSWEENVVDAKVRPTERFLMLFPPGPAVATDAAGERVYVAFQDGRSGDADVRLWASTNGGRSWGPPVRVNDTRMGDGTAQYLSEVAVSPNGRVDVVYYDRRRDVDNESNDVSFQSSFDHGRSFLPALRLTDAPFDAGIGFGGERGLAQLGSRLGLLSTNQGALAMWSDTRTGDRITNKQDLGAVLVEVSAPSALRGPMRAGGIVAIAAGAAVFVAFGLRRKPR